MTKNMISSLVIIALLGSILTVTSTVMAQTSDPTIPGHPRVNEVDQRLENQQNRINSGVASGKISAKKEARDAARDNRVSQELSADQAKNGGHITRAEQRQLNRQLNRNSGDIAKQKAAPPAPTAQ